MDVIYIKGFLTGLAILTFFYFLLTLIECLFGFRQLKTLSQQTMLSAAELPSLTLIFSALNEENELNKTLPLLLQLDYPGLELIAVNDRSTDGTAAILTQYQRQCPKLQVQHIHHLPEGWLGKNYALHQAAKHAKGDWLLFTDADVVMKNPLLKQAMSYAISHQLDHLTIYEDHLRKQFGLKILLFGSYVTYSMTMKPWRIRYPWSKKYLGHGAFNLVKKSAYLQCKGHEAIAMECLDDMKLGRLMKTNGYRQDVVKGHGLIEREWYRSMGEMIQGFQKNSFAHFNYQLSRFLGGFIFAILFFIWPLIAALFCAGTIRWINIANVVLTFLLSCFIAKQFQLSKKMAVFYPAAIILLLYAIWNSVIAIYKNHGIIWRGTHYPLAKLRGKNLHS